MSRSTRAPRWIFFLAVMCLGWGCQSEPSAAPATQPSPSPGPGPVAVSETPGTPGTPETPGTPGTPEAPERLEASEHLVAPIQKGDKVGDRLGPPTSSLDLGEPMEMTPAERDAVMEVYTDPGEIPRMKIEVDGKKFDLPLKHTHVDADLEGPVARVEITQTYQNPFTYPIETVYVFPLPENSAVDDMKIVIGERVIEAEIKERGEARRVYEEARAQGQTAALLEQERPNIFTQSVANIAPGEDIEVVIRYAQDLTYDAGEYEFVFPMVVGPRFMPGEPGGEQGSGWAKDTDEVPDASRISPPIVGGGMRTGHDISIEVDVNAGFPVGQWEAPTHTVDGEVTGSGELKLALAEHASLPNRDFVLRYGVAASEPQATVLVHRDGDGGYFTLIAQPPEADVDALVGQREMIFVVDISGSMYGVPLGLCKDAMREALLKLRPVDTFNVITFAGQEKLLFTAPRPANKTNVTEAVRLIDGLNAGGGTMMGQAVEAALSPPVEEGRHRYVFFMTDGLIGNEEMIFEKTEALISKQKAAGLKARVFSFGVGSSPNRALLEGIAKGGDGLSVYASNREDPSRAVNRYFELVDSPVITDIRLDWGDLKVSALHPGETPDLFASHPLVMHGRFEGGGAGVMTLRGDRAGVPIEIPVKVSFDSPNAGDVQGTLWARAKITDLERGLWGGPDEALKKQITALGIAHRIVTAYTSFVAVDRSRKVGDGDPMTVVQPVENPEGMALQLGTMAMGTSGAGVGGGGALYGLSTTGKMGGRKGSYGVGSGGEIKERGQKLPVLKPGRFESSGSLDKKVIKRVVRRHKRKLTFCYERELRKDPALAGKIVIEWTISSTGTVDGVKVVSNALNEAIGQCLTRTIKGWRFPAPTGGGSVEVKFPFIFDAK